MNLDISFADEIRELANCIIQLQSELQSIRAVGTTAAHAHWQDGRYLYLVHPRKKGTPRVREYIGNDPQRTQATLELVARSRRARQLEATITLLTNKKQQVEALLHEALETLGDAWIYAPQTRTVNEPLRLK
jgi:DNA-binding transcriptional regulator YbjK